MKAEKAFGNFSLKHVYKIQEIQVELYHLVHEKSGAEVVYIKADDEENVFALSFKTYPPNDSGIAHILEHTVLCGSQNYPVHDPFFSMTRKSANTFMNAFTSKLWTSYPAASKIKKDFYNLLDVYIDAVFHPLLKKVSFDQEGHRLEFQEPANSQSPLTIKGVVYNEMKGVYANPSSLLFRQLMHGLFPDTTYGYDSGGDPKAIPSLSHEALIQFHKDYYHPSRCVFYFYGNIPLEEHLAYLEKKILHKTIPLAPIAVAKLQPRFKEPKHIVSYYPSSLAQLTKKTFIGFGFLTCNIQKQDDILALSLLDSIMMDTDASLLKHKLLQSNLCIEVTSSYDPDAREMPYAIIFRGCESENADSIEKLFFQTLLEIASKEIPRHLIDSSLHQLEFARSEIGFDGQPYGLELWGRTILPYLQGGSLEEGLKVHSLFERLENLLKDKYYLSNILKRYLIDNPHHVRLTLIPDHALLDRMKKEESDWLEKKKNALSEEEKHHIVHETQSLGQYQKDKEKETLDCLPSLSLKDISKEVSYFPLHKTQCGPLQLYHHPNFTNQILYADLVFDLPQIQEEDLPYLRLFAAMLTELGCGGRSYVDNLHYQQAHIGGIWTSLSLNVQKDNLQTCYPTFSLSGKVLEKKGKELFHLMRDFILKPDINDRERISELVLQTETYLHQKLNSDAIQYALRESASSFSPWNYINYLWHGMPYYNFIKHLASDLTHSIPLIQEKFTSLSNCIFHLNNAHILLSCSQDYFRHLEKEHFYGFDRMALASKSFCPWIELPVPNLIPSSLKVLSYPIAHTALSLSTVHISSKYAAPLKIASYLFENLVTHKEVREKGGAYISGVKYNILTGNFQFYSSRDPNIYSTYRAFLKAPYRISEGDFTEQDLLEAKLSYIQDVDGVVSPGQKASVTYFQLKVGLTKEERQKFRDQILSCTREDVIYAVREYLLEPLRENSIFTVYANQELIQRDLSLLEQDLPQKPFIENPHLEDKKGVSPSEEEG